jgi:hypothetical protein
MQRSEIFMGVSPVTYERIVQTRYSFRHLERMPLGLDYPSQVACWSATRPTYSLVGAGRLL